MAILNYTTKVPISKTVQEIQERLVKHGAEKVIVDYEAKTPVSITFCIRIADRPVFFTLPSNMRGVLKAMALSKVEKRYLNQDHAEKVAWRILKDWIEAQLAIVEAELADMAQVFLGYSVTNNGSTLYSELKSNNMNLLTTYDD